MDLIRNSRRGKFAEVMMASLKSFVSLLFAVTVSIVANAEQTFEQVAFEELLQESGLSFQAPDGFSSIPLASNPLFPCEKSMQHVDRGLEVRYAIRPLARISIDYEDPHNAAPEPNHLFPMMFGSITQTLSTGRHAPSQEYSPDQSMELFNADWAAASVFDVDERFSTDYNLALLVALHKNNQADAYMIYLFNDYEQVRTLIDASMPALKFIP